MRAFYYRTFDAPKNAMPALELDLPSNRVEGLRQCLAFAVGEGFGSEEGQKDAEDGVENAKLK